MVNNIILICLLVGLNYSTTFTKLPQSLLVLSLPRKSDSVNNYTYIWDEFANSSGDIPGDDILAYGGSYGPFHNYSEIVDKIICLNQTFPEWVELEIIGQSYFNRSIWCVHVTDENITENKENILIVGQHHAREQITVEQALYVIDYLIFSVQESQESQESISILLQNKVFSIIPSLNVDGASILHRYPWQRKTLRPIDEDLDGIQDEIDLETSDINQDGYIEIIASEEMPDVFAKVETEGVDLDQDGKIGEDSPGGVDPNRNYAYDFGNPYFSSDLKSSQIYHGLNPFSENCTRVFRDFLAKFQFPKVLTLHSGIFAVYCPPYSQNSVRLEDEEFYQSLVPIIQANINIEMTQVQVSAGMFVPWMYYTHIESKMVLNLEIYGNLSAYHEEPIVNSSLIRAWGVWDFFNPPANLVINNCQIWWPVLLDLFTYNLADFYSIIPEDDGSETYLDSFPLLGGGIISTIAIGIILMKYWRKKGFD